MGRMLYEPLVHVPMVVKFPGAARAARASTSDPVQLVDVMPTVLAGGRRAGDPGGMQGERAAAGDAPDASPRRTSTRSVSFYGDVYNRAHARRLRRPLQAHHHVARRADALRPRRDDPGETQRSRGKREPERVAEHGRRLEAAIERPWPPTKATDR